VVALLVSFVHRGFESSQQITRMNDGSGTTSSTRTKRRHSTGVDSIGVDRLGGEHEVGAFVELGAYVVVVATSRDDTRVDRL